MMNPDEKLALIDTIVSVQEENQNNEDGDRHLADAYLAMEAIECVLDGTTSRALRQYLEAGDES
jgi:hypothetical protein